MKRVRRSRRSVMLAVAAVSSLGAFAQGAIDWAGVSTDWSTGTNWVGGSVPTASDVARFDRTSYTGSQPTAATVSVGGIEIGDGTTTTGSLTLTGTSITIGSSGVTMFSSAGTANLQSGITLGANQTWTNNSSVTLTKNLTSATSLVLNTNGYQLTTAGSGAIVIRNAITGTGSIVKTGTGTLTIGRVGQNTFSGGLTIKAGTVIANGDTATNSAAALGAGTVTLGDSSGTDAATLSLNNGGGSGGNTIISSPLVVAAGSSGKLLLTTGTTGQQTFAGAITLNNDLTLSNFAGGTLTINVPATSTGITGSKNLIIDGSNVWLDGAGGSGNPNFTGSVLVKSGKFSLNNANAIIWGSTVDRAVLSGANAVGVASGATFDWRNSKIAIAGLNDYNGGGIVTNGTSSGAAVLALAGNGSYNFSGTIQDGALAKLGLTVAVNGTQNLSGSNSYTGVTTLQKGTLEATTLANGGTASSIGAATNAATDTVFNGGALRYIGAGSNTDRLFTVASGGATLDASGTGAVSFTNSGSAAIIDAAGRTGNTTSGSATISGLSGAMFDLVVGQTVLMGDGSSVLGKISSIDLQNKSITLDTAVGATVAGQALAFKADRTLVLTGNSAAANTLNAVLSDATTNIPAVGNGTLSVAKTGTGTWTLNGNNTYTGSTTVSNGKLIVNGSLAGPLTITGSGSLGGTGSIGGLLSATGGTLAPGSSPGTMTLGGGLSLDSASQVVLDITGALAGSEFDQIRITGGSVDLGGASLALLLGAYDPAEGTSFRIIDNQTASSVVGTFAGLSEGSAFTVDGKRLAITYAGGDGNDVVLTSVVVPEPSLVASGALVMLALRRRHRRV